ncbi:hypothetical protein ACJMK2_019877 [Sinanodonta woodiana]|uniref:Uncharacterized protein n=1 Tax=Sinanodonta woodiana TaxID=1069815 RepID=A0ABD3TXC4_SINWO
MFKFCLLSALFLVTQAHWPARRGYYRPVRGIGGVFSRPNLGGSLRGFGGYGGWFGGYGGLGQVGYGWAGSARNGILHGGYGSNGFRIGHYGGIYPGYGRYGYGWDNDWDDNNWVDNNWVNRWDDWDDFRYLGYGIGHRNIKYWSDT